MLRHRLFLRSDTRRNECTVELTTQLPIRRTVMALLIFIMPAVPIQVQGAGVCDFYVATTGLDTNPGIAETSPWKTIQKAANTASAGKTVCVLSGTYNEVVAINKSGDADNGFITFMSYPSDGVAILDVSGRTPPSGKAPVIKIQNKSFIRIKGFEIRNYKTSAKGSVPIGILMIGSGRYIELRNNNIHDIQTTSRYGNAHGIAVYGTGTTSATAITNLVIEGNQVHHLKLGSSESLVVNGNVDGFEINNNIVHDNDNIGIDVIGYEKTSSNSTYDQARNGRISGNEIYNIDSYSNPAYGKERSAGGIYVDGGRDTIIERNIVHHANLGIELASEHAGRATSGIIVRSNLFWNNTQAGIAFGGYNTRRGSTQNCVIVNNTLYNNATQGDWGAEVYVQYDTRANVVMNNLIFAGASRRYLESWSPVMSGNVVDYNLYWADGDHTSGTWIWKNVKYNTFADYQATGNDTHSWAGEDPLLKSVTPEVAGFLHLGCGSPAINNGGPLAGAAEGDADIDNQTRILGGAVDIGADEAEVSQCQSPSP